VDLAKNVFQVHSIGADGIALIRPKLRRSEAFWFFPEFPPRLVGLEACASVNIIFAALTTD